MQKVDISPEEQVQLRNLARKTKDAKTAIRIRVILALNDGWKVRDVAKLFLLDEDTVTKWKQRYLNRRLFTDWLAVGTVGYNGKLTRDQLIELNAYVDAETITDAAKLIDYIKEHYGVEYTVDGVTKLLHRLDFVYKYTVLIPGKLDEEKQAAFKKEYEELKAKLKDTEVILFADGVHPSHNVHATKAWIKKGKDKQVPTNTGRQRLNINGVLNLETMDTVEHFCDTINAETTMELYDKVQAAYPDKTTIYIIEDNARYYKNKAIDEYLANKKCRIKIKYLPAYSPNLNPIEMLWHYMKKNIIGVKRRQTFKEFEEDVHAFFDNIQDYEQELRQFIGTGMHLIKLQKPLEI